MSPSSRLLKNTRIHASPAKGAARAERLLPHGPDVDESVTRLPGHLMRVLRSRFFCSTPSCRKKHDRETQRTTRRGRLNLPRNVNSSRIANFKYLLLCKTLPICQTPFAFMWDLRLNVDKSASASLHAGVCIVVHATASRQNTSGLYALDLRRNGVF